MGNKFTRREWMVGITTGSLLSLQNPLQTSASSASGTPAGGETLFSSETGHQGKAVSNSRYAETSELHAPDDVHLYNELKDFQLLMRTHPPKLDIPDDLSQIPSWRQTAASRFREILCLDASRPVPLNPRMTWTSKREGYRIEHIVLRTREFAEAPGLMLIPDGVSASHPAPAVLCLHGGVPGGKDEVAGETANPEVRRGLAEYHDNYAQQLAKQGIVTFAIDLVDFGERQYQSQSDPYGLKNPAKAHITIANSALMLGRTFFGLNLFDSIRALDYLESRPEVLRARVGCAGFSFGANLAAWLGALDRRIKTIAIEGSWASWRRLAMRDLGTPRYWYGGSPIHILPHLSYQATPGFLRDLDMNLSVALAAPTPMIIAYEYGNWQFDGIGEAKKDAEPIIRAYAGFEMRENLRIVYMPGPHQWRGEVLLPWFISKLRSNMPL